MPEDQPLRKGILALLETDEPLRTPVFQRSFAWTAAQVDEYWNDLTSAIDSTGGPRDYFFGLVVLDRLNEIQDGQQRLATTLLLATEIYSEIETAKRGVAHDENLARNAIGQVAAALRLSPSSPLALNHDDQIALLARTGVSGNSPESAKRIVAARRRLRDRLQGDLRDRTSPDAKLARLKSFGEFLRSKAYLVVLRVPARDAHHIFETLNTRGVRLSNGDLVKSHLIAKASDTQLALTKWHQITRALTNARGRFEDDLESFLLHYFGSKYAKTTTAAFFSDYRIRIEGVDATTVLDQLLESAFIYRALLDPSADPERWAILGPRARRAVELVNGLGLKQLRYLLLAVLRDLGSELTHTSRVRRQREALVKIGAWSVRGLVLGLLGGGEAERTYISAAAEIRENRITTIEALRDWFLARKTLAAENAAFRRSFSEFAFDRPHSSNRARAILYALEYAKISEQAGIEAQEDPDGRACVTQVTTGGSLERDSVESVPYACSQHWESTAGGRPVAS